MEPELRAITAVDWEAFRAVRLRALADAPDSFGVTLAEAADNPESAWRERASGPSPIVLAFSGERPVAMGGLYAPEDSPDAFVWGMWVEPESRGRGLGARLLRDLLARFRERSDDRTLWLHVTEGNDGARRLYEAHGFVATGEWQPLREGPDLQIESLRLET